MYSKRTFLNRPDSPSTSSVVAFNGKTMWRGKKIDNTFLSVSGCYVSARLTKTEDDTTEDFIDKMKVLRNEIDLFINYLKEN